MRDATTTLNLIKHQVENIRDHRAEDLRFSAGYALEIISANICEITIYAASRKHLSRYQESILDPRALEELLSNPEQIYRCEQVRQDLLLSLSAYIEIMKDMIYDAESKLNDLGHEQL